LAQKKSVQTGEQVFNGMDAFVLWPPPLAASIS
jgi:hypothetical protein